MKPREKKPEKVDNAFPKFFRLQTKERRESISRFRECASPKSFSRETRSMMKPLH